jgi:hypothetical protein
MSLRESWDAHASDWIDRARTEDYDHFFRRLSMPAVLALVRPPGRLAASIVHPFNSPKAGVSFEAYGPALERAGLCIEAIREPVPDDAYVARRARTRASRAAP